MLKRLGDKHMAAACLALEDARRIALEATAPTKTNMATRIPVEELTLLEHHFRR